MAIANTYITDIFGKPFAIKFIILENVIPQMLLSVIFQTFFFWVTRLRNGRYTPVGVYAVLNQVTLRPKEIIHMFVA